ncbi:hypothetical protein V8D89_011186 [Ganoderma adspersum]
MFSASLRAALVALVGTASAVTVAAAPGLSLKVTGPAAVDGVENLQIVTAVTNTGDETLRLLNDPNGVLNPLPADTFTITSPDGARPSFTGVRVKYSPSQAAKSTDPAAFTVLEPGASVSIAHDIASAYNFTTTGHREYTIKAPNSFYAVDANNAVSLVSATTEPHSATLTGGDLVAIRGPGLTGSIRKRANFNGCSEEQQAALTAAALGAYDYATAAWSYLDYYFNNADADSDTPRYSTWFGAPDSDGAARHGTVLSHFERMAGNDFTAFSYDCTCTDPGVFAYVYPEQFGAVYLCGAFWDAPPRGTDSKAGTLVHEASHFTVNGGTKDYAYGQTDAMALAQSNPEEAVMNADSHEYFAENNPSQE